VLKPAKTKDGYLKVELFDNATPRCRCVHRLVVKAFIGEVPAGLEVNQISGVKTDNTLENLEVVTHATLLDSVGTPLGTVQALLGHSSSEITRGTYISSVPEDARKAVEGVENLIGPKFRVGRNLAVR
jgi:HNH endonuclease